MSVVLMYHGLHPDGDPGGIDAEDRPYALGASDFARQLDALVRHREDGDRTPPLITFDDGHASARSIALPLLRERALEAVFFVTSGFVGRRPGFCDAAALAELAGAGMTIGAHGATHAFLDDLDATAAAAELGGSRERLRAMGLGAVDAMSFPGGRWRRETLVLAERAGYRALFGSEPGTIDRAALARGRTIDGAPLPRVAIRRDMPMEEFRRVVDADPVYLRRLRAGQGAKRAVRAALGNRLYHGLYRTLRRPR